MIEKILQSGVLPMEYVKKLAGERVYLSPMRLEDAEQYVRWLNDPAVTDGLGTTQQVFGPEGERKWLAENEGEFQFAIVRQTDDTLIGNCGIQNIQWQRRSAEMGLFIGDVENRGRGYGKEVLRLLLAFAFDTLGLHSVSLKVFSFNAPAIAAYKAVGFRPAGCRREAYFVRGAWHDELTMDLLESEYRAGQKKN